MRHVTFASRSFLIGDAAASALMEYARVIADPGRADSVTLRARMPDGEAVEASFLLNASTKLMIVTMASNAEPPDNERATLDLRDRIAALSQSPRANVEEPWTDHAIADWEFP